MYLWFIVVGVLFVKSCHGTVDVEDNVEIDAVVDNVVTDESGNPIPSATSSDVGQTDPGSGNSNDDGAPVVNSEVAANGTADDGQSVVEEADGGRAAVNTSTTENAVKRVRPTKVDCLRLNTTTEEVRDGQELTVQILNQTSHPDLFKTTPNATVAPCSLMLFYAPFCPFSAGAAPHFNAMARLYPDIPCVAVDASTYVSLNARYGTVALPTLYLFHNGHPVAKFNESTYTLDRFVAFVRKYASIEPEGLVNVTSADFIGPLPSEPVQETDWLLWLAWWFVICCSGYGVTKSSLWHRMLESLRNNWQEAEAQHEHVE